MASRLEWTVGVGHRLGEKTKRVQAEGTKREGQERGDRERKTRREYVTETAGLQGMLIGPQTATRS